MARRNKLIYITLALVWCKNIAAALPHNIVSPVNVEKFCQSYSGQSHFLNDLSSQVIANRATRLELVRLLKLNKALGCRQSLADYLNQFIDEPQGKEYDKNFDSYLLLSFVANLPQAVTLIEKKIDNGELVEWLDVFEKADKEAYFKTLSRWVNRIANLLRTLDRSPTVDIKMYGKNAQSDDKISTPDSIPIWNPLFINKYLSEVKSQHFKLSKNEFANLNIIYAASNQSYRDIFLVNMADAVRISETNWVMSFREEPTWVQFRLFPVMGKVGGGVVKRELIWLSNYHENFKFRAVAQSTLEKIVSKS